MTRLVGRCAKYAANGRIEFYKVSIKYDNPQARIPHDFPLEPTVKEVKEMFRRALGGSPSEK